MIGRAVNYLSNRLRCWRYRLGDGALILVYHRVAALPTDPQLLAVTPDNFAAQMEFLRRRCRPVALPELAETPPPRAIAVTFDDGYADNLLEAKPILQRFEIPATVFVTTGRLGDARESWWDDTERLLLTPGALPREFDATIGGERLRRDLGDAAIYDDAAWRVHRDWSVVRTDDPTPRHALYRELCSRLKPLPADEQERALSEIRRWAGADAAGRADHRALTENEVRELADGGLVDVGGHTVTHAALSRQPLDRQKWEIAEGKATLEKILGRPIRSFAYPYGGKADYDDQTLRLTREAGFEFACSGFPGLVRRGGDRYQWPRLLVRNWDAARFARIVMGWL